MGKKRQVKKKLNINQEICLQLLIFYFYFYSNRNYWKFRVSLVCVQWFSCSLVGFF